MKKKLLKCLSILIFINLSLLFFSLFVSAGGILETDVDSEISLETNPVMAAESEKTVYMQENESTVISEEVSCETFVSDVYIDSQVAGTTIDISSLIDSIPKDIIELLPEELFSSDPTVQNNAAKEVSGFSFLIRALFKITMQHSPMVVTSLSLIIGLVVISAIFNAVSGVIKNSTLSTSLSTISSVCIAAAIIEGQRQQLMFAIEYLNTIRIFMQSMIPIMGAIYASGGNISSASVSHTAMLIFLNVIETMCNKTLVPVLQICFAFAILGAFSGTLNFSGVTAFIKKFYTATLSFLMSLLIAIMSFQQTIAAASDTVVARTLKFSAGLFIPVVGGAVGDLVRTVSGGMSLIKNSVGIIGIIVILIMFIPVVATLFMNKVALNAGGIVAEIVGCERERKLMGELSGIYGLMIAVVSVFSIVFILALTIFIKSTVAIGE